MSDSATATEPIDEMHGLSIAAPTSLSSEEAVKKDICAMMEKVADDVYYASAHLMRLQLTDELSKTLGNNTPDLEQMLAQAKSDFSQKRAAYTGFCMVLGKMKEEAIGKKKLIEPEDVKAMTEELKVEEGTTEKKEGE